MQKLFRLAPLPVVVLGLFASLFMSLSLSSPAEALICKPGEVVVEDYDLTLSASVTRVCATKTTLKEYNGQIVTGCEDGQVPVIQNDKINCKVLYGGKESSRTDEPLYCASITGNSASVRLNQSNGGMGDRELCATVSKKEDDKQYCSDDRPGGVPVVANKLIPGSDGIICYTSTVAEHERGMILPSQSGTPGTPGGGPAAPGQTNPDGTPVEGGATGTLMDCNIGGIGWIICPVMRTLSEALDGAFNFISEKFLIINNDLFDGTTLGFWNAFRNVANALFALVFLVVIASQVSNIGISNYGIKKLLPKLIMVAILVNLSFTLCKIAVDLSNIAGMAANNIFSDSLITESFSETEINRASGVPNIQAGVITVGVLGITAAAALYIAFPTLLLVLITGILAVLSAVIILTAREALVLILVVISPLAIASTLLPNTQKLFDKWKSLFMGMLLVFPTIGLIWGASSATATIMASRPASGPNDWINQILALAVMSIPLFATIPVVKGSMNALGKVGAKLNDMGGKFKGGVDNWYKGSRAGKWGDHLQQQRARNRSISQAGVTTPRRGLGKLRNIAPSIHGAMNNRKGNEFGKDLANSGQAEYDEAARKDAANAIQYQYKGSLEDALYDKKASSAVQEMALEQLAGKGDWGAGVVANWVKGERKTKDADGKERIAQVGAGNIKSHRAADTISGLKTKHAGLGGVGTEAKQHFENGNSSPISFTKEKFTAHTESTIKGMGDATIAGQIPMAIQDGANSEYLRQHSVDILNNPELLQGLTAGTESELRNLSGGREKPRSAVLGS